MPGLGRETIALLVAQPAPVPGSKGNMNPALGEYSLPLTRTCRGLRITP